MSAKENKTADEITAESARLATREMPWTVEGRQRLERFIDRAEAVERALLAEIEHWKTEVAIARDGAYRVCAADLMDESESPCWSTEAQNALRIASRAIIRRMPKD